MRPPRGSMRRPVGMQATKDRPGGRDIRVRTLRPIHPARSHRRTLRRNPRHRGRQPALHRRLAAALGERSGAVVGLRPDEAVQVLGINGVRYRHPDPWARDSDESRSSGNKFSRAACMRRSQTDDRSDTSHSRRCRPLDHKRDRRRRSAATTALLACNRNKTGAETVLSVSSLTCCSAMISSASAKRSRKDSAYCPSTVPGACEPLSMILAAMAIRALMSRGSTALRACSCSTGSKANASRVPRPWPPDRGPGLRCACAPAGGYHPPSSAAWPPAAVHVTAPMSPGESHAATRARHRHGVLRSTPDAGSRDSSRDSCAWCSWPLFRWWQVEESRTDARWSHRRVLGNTSEPAGWAQSHHEAIECVALSDRPSTHAMNVGSSGSAAAILFAASGVHQPSRCAVSETRASPAASP